MIRKPNTHPVEGGNTEPAGASRLPNCRAAVYESCGDDRKGSAAWQSAPRPKSTGEIRNRENLRKRPRNLPSGRLSGGLWTHEAAHTRGFCEFLRNFPSREDSGTERVEFELTGDLCSGL